MPRKDGSRTYSLMRANNGGKAGGGWSNDKQNRRTARKIMKRTEERQWRKHELEG